MKEEKRVSLPAIGGSSLLVIFAVLCLTIFALLSLNTVLAEKRLADNSLRSVTSYYQADLEAEKIFAQLRSGTVPSGVAQEGDCFRYTCPISQYQTLLVELKKTPEGWTVLRWQALAHPEAINETLPVWDGQ